VVGAVRQWYTPSDARWCNAWQTKNSSRNWYGTDVSRSPSTACPTASKRGSLLVIWFRQYCAGVLSRTIQSEAGVCSTDRRRYRLARRSTCMECATTRMRIGPISLRVTFRTLLNGIHHLLKEGETMTSHDTRKCTKCGAQTEWTLTSVEMTDEQSSVTVNGVPAMACPRCGEEYIPGLQAMSLSKAAEEIFSILRTTQPAEAVA